jgi:hypothetical protein
MSIKKTPKAKSQKTVSRAVKEAGFKNIKEAKETLHKYKEELTGSCCNSGGCEADLKTKPDTMEYLQQIIASQREKIIRLESLLATRTEQLNQFTLDCKKDSYYENLEAAKKTQTNTTGYLHVGEQKKAEWLPIQAIHNGLPVAIRVWAVI